MRIVIRTPVGTELTIPGVVDLGMSVTEFYEHLVLTSLPAIGVDLTQLTRMSYLSHAFWFTVEKYGKERLLPTMQPKLFLNSNESIEATLAYMFGVRRLKPDKVLYLNLMTHEENVCIMTDEGQKCLDIPTASFAINLEEVQVCIRRIFPHIRLPGLRISKEDSKFVLSGDTPYIWKNFVPWIDSNRHRHLFYADDPTLETLHEEIQLETGFEWEGNIVVDKRQCFFKCKPRKNGGAQS